jgi:hypothetical protein
MYLFPIRVSRVAAARLSGGETTLHYRPITANYRDYWMADSDAVNSIDMFEAYLWFRSRSDECLNCPSRRELIRTEDIPLIIRVKTTPAPTRN